MKPIKFLPIVMIAAAGLVASCSTSKLAQNSASDDVYNTVAKAREVEYHAPVAQTTYQGQQDGYDEYYGTSNPYYDMDYSSRINRFYNGSTFRGYYDPYYDYNYNNYNYLGYGLGAYNGYGLGAWGGSFNIGFGYGSIWNNPYNYGYFGYNPYSAWGPYSYYDAYGWGGGFYGGGYYGGLYGLGGYGGGYGGVYTNRNNRVRPNRDGDNRGAYGNNGTSFSSGNNAGRVSVGNINAGRPERYSGSNGSTISNQQGGISSRPTRDQGYTQQAQPQTQQFSRPERSSYSPPAQQSSGGGGGGGVSSGGGGGGGRPTRGGGR